MTDLEVVLRETDGPIATISLNRPKVFNAIDSAMRGSLRETIDAVNGDPEIRIVILKGEGRGFCGGADLGEGLGGSVTDELENEYKPLLMGIADSPKIWIASVHGSAAGIGGALAMNCDLMVMAENANIYLAFAAIGLIPDGGSTWLLLRAMGYHRALETIVEGRKISSAECLAMGLANRIAPPETVHEASRYWADQLARGAPLAQSTAKRVMRQLDRLDFSQAISLEAVEQQPLTESEDCRNAIAAFLAKRKPEFRGK